MTDPRILKLADVLVNYSVKVKPGDWVLLRSDFMAEPLAQEVYKKIIEAGGNCDVSWNHDGMMEAYFNLASSAQLDWLSPVQRMLYEQANALIALRAPSNTRNLSGVATAKQQQRGITLRPLQETYMARAAKNELRWVVTNFPCPAYAQEADMSLADYEDFVYGTTFCDKDDPAAEWRRVHDEQQRMVDWLKGKKKVTLKSPNVDLSLSIEGRSFINSDGTHNMPSGEIFTGPVETSANGWVHFTYPAIRGGREVEGVRLTFKDGKVVEASASKNEEYLISQLDSDEGARYLGEFAIGTNYGISKFTKTILYDEKIGGSFHMAVGSGYPETGSVNKSAIHWDFICDVRQDSEILVDGELFYKNGQFQV